MTCTDSVGAGSGECSAVLPVGRLTRHGPELNTGCFFGGLHSLCEISL